MQYLIIFLTVYTIVCKNQQIGVIGNWTWWEALVPVAILAGTVTINTIIRIKLTRDAKKLVDRITSATENK